MVFGGSPHVDKAWDPAISVIMRDVIQARYGITTPLSVNVVFHVTGELLQAEFSGVRTGTFSRKRMLLMVQAAVPLEPVEDRRGVLLVLLRSAVDAAEEFAIRRKIAGGLPEIRAIVEAVAQDPQGGHG
ncbi:hypothetical protein N802_13690 [Knoellia sinensis KCTC 19936]|uniref:Uncharacterized protein n=1 Tax=Knoellia sinensis KCTC 19936 TaxID=1385520 RepID=A0A0A0J179_9MICO|nr:hypothetical protein N802_13690 [Knoellia sinensis KCTC 19936]